MRKGRHQTHLGPRDGESLDALRNALIDDRLTTGAIRHEVLAACLFDREMPVTSEGKNGRLSPHQQLRHASKSAMVANRPIAPTPAAAAAAFAARQAAREVQWLRRQYCPARRETRTLLQLRDIHVDVRPG